jgi:hypothetical protein
MKPSASTDKGATPNVGKSGEVSSRVKSNMSRTNEMLKGAEESETTPTQDAASTQLTDAKQGKAQTREITNQVDHNIKQSNEQVPAKEEVARTNEHAKQSRQDTYTYVTTDAALPQQNDTQKQETAWDYNDTASLQKKLDGRKGNLQISELRGGGASFLAFSHHEQNDHNDGKAKYASQTEQNKYQGKVGENPAVRERVYQILFPQTDAHLSGVTEVQHGKEQRVPIDSRERAFKSAEQYFHDHPDAQNVIATRKYSGGAPYSLDGIDMLITRQHIEQHQQGKEVTPLYLASESKTGESQLSPRQRMFSYVEKQATHMSKNQKHADRQEAGADMLHAVEQEKAMYVIYRTNTKTGDIEYEVQSGLHSPKDKN